MARNHHRVATFSKSKYLYLYLYLSIHSVHRSNRASGLAIPLPSMIGRAEEDLKLGTAVNEMPHGTDLIIIIRSAVGLTSHIP